MLITPFIPFVIRSPYTRVECVVYKRHLVIENHAPVTSFVFVIPFTLVLIQTLLHKHRFALSPAPELPATDSVLNLSPVQLLCFSCFGLP